MKRNRINKACLVSSLMNSDDLSVPPPTAGPVNKKVTALDVHMAGVRLDALEREYRRTTSDARAAVLKVEMEAADLEWSTKYHECHSR